MPITLSHKRSRLSLKFLLLVAAILLLGCHGNLGSGQSLKEGAQLCKKSSKLYKQGRYQEAIPIAKRCLAIVEEAFGPDHIYVAAQLNNLAELYTKLGDYTKAKPLFKRSLTIVKKNHGPEDQHVADSLNNLAGLYVNIGEYDRAKSLMEESLAIRKRSLGPEHQDVADSLNNLAELYRLLGDYAKAEPLFKRSLAVFEKVLDPNHQRVALSLNNLAGLYRNLGDYARAESLNKRSLTISEKSLGPNHPVVAANLNNLAELYKYLGDYARAEPLYKRSLAIVEKSFGPGHMYVEVSRNNLALLYLADGKIAKAIEIFQKNNSRAGLGACHLAQGDYGKAMKEFQNSLEITRKLGRTKFIIGDHIGLGLSYEGLDDLKMAKRHFSMAIDLIDAQWRTLALPARRAFLEGWVGVNFPRLDAFEGIVRTIIKEKKKGYQKNSLLYAEAVKSRTLLEMLAAKGTKGIGNKDKEILTIDRRFQHEITTLKKTLSTLMNLGASAPKGEKENAEQQVAKTSQDYERFINDIKLSDSEVASLISVKATPVEKIQSLLDQNTTILEYFITKDETYAWLITKDQISVHELNLGKKRLLAAINQLLLPNISNRPRKPEPVITLPTGGPRATETDKQQRVDNRKRFLEATRDFYRSIFEPIAGGLRTEGLIIVPHGALHKVPFAALNDGEKFLVDKYALSIVPSSSVLEYVVKKRKENTGRLLAFANPKTEYVPLEFAETEVANISGMFSDKQIYSRNEATESKAKEGSKSPDIIHFACHGEFNDKQPMQSGLLLTKDERNDGYLQVHEIFGLDLRNTNLVVLSACKTALSKIYGGDDLVGLSRGFIYAGTPSLLATLWEVDDHSTAILIEEFYKNWQKRGMSKPKALQQAQVALKTMPQYQHPYFWAPFIMIGDWH